MNNTNKEESKVKFIYYMERPNAYLKEYLSKPKENPLEKDYISK